MLWLCVSLHWLTCRPYLKLFVQSFWSGNCYFLFFLCVITHQIKSEFPCRSMGLNICLGVCPMMDKKQVVQMSWCLWLTQHSAQVQWKLHSDFSVPVREHLCRQGWRPRPYLPPSSHRSCEESHYLRERRSEWMNPMRRSVGLDFGQDTHSPTLDTIWFWAFKASTRLETLG